MSSSNNSGGGNLSSSSSSGQHHHQYQQRQDSPMVDEMFDGPGGQMDVVEMDGGPDDVIAVGLLSAGSSGVGVGGQQASSSSLMSALTANERTVHADFFNNFGSDDLFDDADLS